MDVLSESPLELISDPPEGERILFTASVCPMKPWISVKFFLGKENEIGLMYPDILDDIGSNRTSGPVYHLAMGRQYPQLGAFQVSLAYPVLSINRDLARASVEVLYATASTWTHTHLVCPQEETTKRVLSDLIPLLGDCPIQLTLWAWSCL
jgi:hypothetical protein